MRIYLHLIEPEGASLDGEGIDFSSRAAAREAAVKAIRDIAAADVREGRPIRLNRWIDVTDSEGELIERVSFAEAVVIDVPTIH
jgi:hypothetical protein